MIGPKANKFIEVKPPEGVSDLFSLIAFLNDKKLVEKHLKSIQEYTEKANAATVKLSKSENIDDLLLDAELKHKAAESLVSDAQDEASLIAESAAKDAQQARDAAQADITALLTEAKETNTQAKYDLAQLKIAQEQADQKDHEATAMLEDLKERTTSIERREHEIERKAEILRQL